MSSSLFLAICCPGYSVFVESDLKLLLRFGIINSIVRQFKNRFLQYIFILRQCFPIKLNLKNIFLNKILSC